MNEHNFEDEIFSDVKNLRAPKIIPGQNLPLDAALFYPFGFPPL